MKSGDPCIVRNLDDEETGGMIVTIHATRASEWPADWMDSEDATLADYWRGKLDDPDCPVVTVELGTGRYDYPAERVTVVDPDDE